MVITKASDCSNFVVSGSLITAWVSDNTIELELRVYKNCSTTSIDITLDSDTYDAGEGGMVITPALLTQTGSTILDDIYFLELESNDDGTIVTEEYCLFINCATRCQIVTYLGDNLYSNIGQLYNTLIDGETCSDDNCSKFCAIYNHIVALLAESNTPDCGNCP